MGFLRILLALAVAIDHSGAGLRSQTLPGIVAVQAFFIISGFYMALILNRKYCFPGATKLFYQQRYLRLIPMYWFSILCTLGASGFYGRLGHHPAGKLQIWAEKGRDLSMAGLGLLLIAQLTMIGLDGLMFCAFSGHPLAPHFAAAWWQAPLPAVRFMLVPPAWSLSVELLFYLCAPFLVRRSIRTQLALAAATFALRFGALSFFHLPAEPWNSRFFPFEAGMFLLGSAAYQMLPAVSRIVVRLPALRWILTSLLFLLVSFYNRLPWVGETRHWIFLACVLCSTPLLFAASERDGIDRWIGEISYPLYLIHQVVYFAAEPVTRRMPGLATDLCALVLPLGAAAVVYALIERPFERWRARRFERRLARAEAGTA